MASETKLTAQLTGADCELQSYRHMRPTQHRTQLLSNIHFLSHQLPAVQSPNFLLACHSHAAM